MLNWLSDIYKMILHLVIKNEESLSGCCCGKLLSNDRPTIESFHLRFDGSDPIMNSFSQCNQVSIVTEMLLPMDKMLPKFSIKVLRDETKRGT